CNLLLIPINWGLETLKWRSLLQGFSDYSFWRTYKAILVGITVGLFTPNRVGEYGGRVLMVAPEHNWKAVVATMVGSFSQLLVLIAFGILGTTYFCSTFLKLSPYLLYILSSLGLLLIVLLLFCFYNIDLLTTIAKRISWTKYFKKYVKDLNVLTDYPANILSKTLGYALLRCVVYFVQYYLMLRFFGIDAPLLTGFAGIATVYLIQTGIPLPPLLDLLARGEIALFVWSYFTTDEVAVLATSFTLFILNLIVPALIGALFIFKINILKSLGL
ncbi:MAG: lysylphosphatidylglycerol synthase domain-containing protein, partial [Bacteroidota bacterium]